MSLATKALALDETLQDVVSELQRINSVAVATDIGDLADVDITSPANNDILKYNSLSQEWENASLPSADINYSTTEKRFGYWTNGKPIYQKTYEGTSNNSQTDIPISVNLETLVNIEVSITAHDGTKCGIYYESASDKVRAWVLAGSNYIRLTLGSNYPSKPVDYSVTIWYTKTTDTV